jgi:carbon storage regulator
MLMLSRYPRQTVLIGRDIEVMILEVIDDRVRLGITAPRELPVLRLELLAKPSLPASP